MITYMNFEVRVPSWAKWLSQDEDSEWIWHANKPEYEYGGWVSRGRMNTALFHNDIPEAPWEMLYEINQ